jgi:hypothetical protein
MREKEVGMFEREVRKSERVYMRKRERERE